jgi:hypothetical protein
MGRRSTVKPVSESVEPKTTKKRSVPEKKNASESDINFANVSKDKKGCGFRHEEFPHVVLEKYEQERYVYLNKRSEYLHRILYSIPCDLPEFIISLYIKNLIELKLSNEIGLRDWWSEITQKYNLPCGIKYNLFQNAFYRHITDDNQVTEFERINN